MPVVLKEESDSGSSAIEDDNQIDFEYVSSSLVFIANITMADITLEHLTSN